MTTIRLTIGGMHCQACVAKLDEAIAALAGVETRSVELGTATVVIDQTRCNAAALAQTVRDAGFQFVGFKQVDSG